MCVSASVFYSVMTAVIFRNARTVQSSLQTRSMNGVAAGLMFTGHAFAAEETAKAVNSAAGWGYLAAALSTGMSCLGGGIAVSAAASAALGAISEDGSILGKSLIFVSGFAPPGSCRRGPVRSFYRHVLCCCPRGLCVLLRCFPVRHRYGSGCCPVLQAL